MLGTPVRGRGARGYLSGDFLGLGGNSYSEVQKLGQEQKATSR